MLNSGIFRVLCIYLALWPSVWGWIYIINQVPPQGVVNYFLGYSASLLIALALMIGLLSRDRSQPVSIEFGRWRWYALGCFLLAAMLGPWLSAPEPAYAYLRLLLLLPLILSGFATYVWFQTLPETKYVQVILAFILGQLVHAISTLPFLNSYLVVLDLLLDAGILPFHNIRRYTNYFAICVPALTGIVIWLQSIKEPSYKKKLISTRLAWIGLCFLWTILFWTGSRAPIFATVCSFLVVMTTATEYGKPILRISAYTAFIGSVASLFMPRPTPSFGVWARMFDSRLYESADSLGSSRLELWFEAWRLFLKNPLFGNGHGQFPFQDGLAGELGLQTPHNFPLEMLNDFGVVGGIAMIALVYGGSVKLVLKARGQNMSPLTLMCMLGLLTMTFQSLFDGNITSFLATIPFALFWGLTAASIRRNPNLS